MSGPDALMARVGLLRIGAGGLVCFSKVASYRCPVRRSKQAVLIILWGAVQKPIHKKRT